FQAEDGIRDFHVTGVQTCALPIWVRAAKLLESRNDLDGAIERYKRALDEQPMNAAAMAGLRDAYATRGDARAAIQLIERELEHKIGRASCRERAWSAVGGEN